MTKVAAGTGLVAAGLMLASFGVLNVAALPADEAAVPAWLTDDAKRGQLLTSWYLVALGAVFSVWFLGELRAVVRRAEGGEGRLAATAFGGGVVSVALFVLGSALTGPVVVAMTRSGFRYTPATDAHLTLVLSGAAFLVLASAGILASVLLAAVAVATLRTGVFPRWFGIASAIGAVLLLGSGFALVPVLLIPAWTAVASVLTMRARHDNATSLPVRAPSR